MEEIKVDFENFEPEIMVKQDKEVYEKMVKEVRNVILTKVLQTNLTNEEKQKIVKHINGIKFLEFYDPKIKGGYDYSKNAVYINKTFEPQEIYETLLHEMLHAASAVLSKESGFTEIKNNKKNYRAINEGFTNLFADSAGREYASKYVFPSRIAEVLTSGLDQNLVFEAYLKGDLELLCKQISTKYNLFENDLVKDLFLGMDPMFENKYVSGEMAKVQPLNNPKFVIETVMKTVECYSKLVASKAMAEENYAPKLVDGACQDLLYDEIIDKYFEYARDVDGNLIDVYAKENKELFNELLDLKEDKKDELTKNIYDYFEQKIENQKIDYQPDPNSKIEHALIAPALNSVISTQPILEVGNFQII